MGFMLITLLVIGLIVVILVLLARAYPGSGADLVDWKPTRWRSTTCSRCSRRRTSTGAGVVPPS